MKIGIGRVFSFTKTWAKGPLLARVTSTALCSMLALSATVSSLACSSTDSPGDDNGTSMPGNVVIQDSHNYTAINTLTIPVIQTAPQANLTIDWSGVSDDIQCHAVQPAQGVDLVSFLRFANMTREQVQELIGLSQLSLQDVELFAQHRTDHQDAQVTLSEFDLFGEALNPGEHYPESDTYTYLTIVAKGIQPGLGSLSMAFLEPTATSTNDQVAVPKGCGILNFQAMIQQAAPLPISLAGPWVLDWGAVTRDSQGNAIAYQNVDRLLLGFYAGMTVADIEQNIFDIEMLATTMYEMPLTGEGTSADLANAVERTSGQPFAGFQQTEQGTWLIGLLCGICQNPAPVILSILQPG